MRCTYSLYIIVLALETICLAYNDVEEGSTTNSLYKIEGKVSVSLTNDAEWVGTSRVLVDGGEYIGFLK